MKCVFIHKNVKPHLILLLCDADADATCFHFILQNITHFVLPHDSEAVPLDKQTCNLRMASCKMPLPRPLPVYCLGNRD